MEHLTRQQLIERLEAPGGEIDALAGWAFDQFYAEEAGNVEFEPGYRHAIGAVLDELMFADDPGFRLSAEQLRGLADRLRAAQAQPDEDDEADEDDV